LPTIIFGGKGIRGVAIFTPGQLMITHTGRRVRQSRSLDRYQQERSLTVEGEVELWGARDRPFLKEMVPSESQQVILGFGPRGCLLGETAGGRPTMLSPGKDEDGKLGIGFS
jgi:hypothetical protein